MDYIFNDGCQVTIEQYARNGVKCRSRIKTVVEAVNSLKKTA